MGELSAFVEIDDSIAFSLDSSDSIRSKGSFRRRLREDSGYMQSSKFQYQCFPSAMQFFVLVWKLRPTVK